MPSVDLVNTQKSKCVSVYRLRHRTGKVVHSEREEERKKKEKGDIA